MLNRLSRALNSGSRLRKIKMLGRLDGYFRCPSPGDNS